MDCEHNVDIELMKDCPGCLRERVEEAEPKAIAFKSLLVELWDGVRAHGLKAPANGRDGERLIHAYCGGIAELRNKVTEGEKRERGLREFLEKLSIYGAPRGEGHSCPCCFLSDFSGILKHAENCELIRILATRKT